MAIGTPASGRSGSRGSLASAVASASARSARTTWKAPIRSSCAVIRPSEAATESAGDSSPERTSRAIPAAVERAASADSVCGVVMARR